MILASKLVRRYQLTNLFDSRKNRITRFNAIYPLQSIVLQVGSYKTQASINAHLVSLSTIGFSGFKHEGA